MVEQQYLIQMSPEYGELRPTSGWHRLVSLGHPCKFQRVSRLGFVTATTSFTGGRPNFARCSAVSWAATLCVHFWELLPPDGISPRAKFTLRPSVALSYIGSVTARHSSQTLRRGTRNGIMELSQRAPMKVCDLFYKTFAEGGHHVGHRPTF